ncbi:MAG: glycosyltransferase [Methylovirgula sp.]|nr:glycosyltransferase [Methylovirgula sp.]
MNPGLSAFGPLLLSVGLVALLVQFGRGQGGLVRALFSALCIALAARYVWWRFEYSLPANQNIYQQAWAWMFFAFETMSICSSTSVILFMSRRGGRTPPAQIPPQIAYAPVDVFIATYNEPYNILERTIVGAKAIEHPDLRVWILDDGARDWVRELADDLGIHYIRRVKGAHAKAGNINNGLRHALAAGRRPDFILVLDADFVPYRNILKRTLGLFAEPDVGIVQTPQHFFNPDPIQNNLALTRVWPDEQRFFFNTLLASKDAWGAAFCCGTSAVFRVDALVAAGGMATETVTEDMLTSFKFGEHGYSTIFLNEMLSMGLAPEGLSSYVSQRSRWCLGAIQQIYTRWSFAGPAKINLINRLSSLDGVLYWMSNAPFKLLMITAPLVYWWTQTAVISSTLETLLNYLAPFVACSILFMGFYAHKRIIPVMTDVTQLLTSFSMVATVAVAIVKPWGHPFKVTAKGISADRVVVQWRYLLVFAAIALGTVAGIMRNTAQFSPLYGTDGYGVNVFWSIFNIAVLVVACAVCVEAPRRRIEERFNSGEAAMVRLANGLQVPCVVRDISLGGANLAIGFGRLRAEDQGCLVLSNGIEAPFAQVRQAQSGIAVRFRLDKETRRQLIARLFTGGYANEVQQIKLGRLFGSVVRRLAA